MFRKFQQSVCCPIFPLELQIVSELFPASSEFDFDFGALRKRQCSLSLAKLLWFVAFGTSLQRSPTNGGGCSLDAALVSCLFITLLASLDGLPATFVFAALA